MVSITQRFLVPGRDPFNQNPNRSDRNFSGWTEPIHWVLDRNFRKVWLNGSRPLFLRSPKGTPGTMTCLLCLKLRPKIPGSTSRKIGRWCAARFLKPLPYCRPKSVIFPALFQTWSQIWYPISDLKPWSPARDRSAWQDTYTVADVNIKREIVLSANDEEVANSSKKHTQFKTSAQTIPYFWLK